MAVPAREMEDDSVLVRAVQGGDLEAFSQLFRRHYADVQRSCARRMSCPLEAEEIAQAAFVRALERIEQCSGERQFGGWVQIIARHMCVDALRARSRVVPRESPMSEHHADGREPQDSLLDRERSDDVRRALDTLPPRQRQAVTARALGTGPGQIADDLGLSVGAVDSLILRGRRQLALAYRRVAGEGGSTATVTSASAAASLLAAFCIGSTRLLGGVAAAAEAGRDLMRPVASGLTGAIMAVSVAITGSGPATAPEPATNPAAPPAAVVVADPFPDQPAGLPVDAGGSVPATGAATAVAPTAGTTGPGAGGSLPGAGGPTGKTAGQPAVGAPNPAAPGHGPGGGPQPASPPAPAGGSVDLDLPPALDPPVLDPVVDVVDDAVPLVTETVDDTTTVVDDTLDTVTSLLPK